MEIIESKKILNVIGLALLVLYIIFQSKSDDTLAKIFLWSTLFILVINTFDTFLGKWIAIGWMKFGQVLGSIISRITLLLIFFCILTPLALIFRLFNPKVVIHFKKKQKKSYFDNLNINYEKSNFDEIW